MWKRCACCWPRSAAGSANLLKRSRSARCALMIDRNPPRRTTTSCWRVVPGMESFNERGGDGSRATSYDPAICQAAPTENGGHAVCGAGRRSGPPKAKPSELFGSTARCGSGGARSQRGSATDYGGTLPQAENPGGVRLRRCTAYSRGSGAEARRGRLFAAQRTDYFPGGNRNRQDALGDGTGGRSLPSEEASAFHDCGTVGE